MASFIQEYRTLSIRQDNQSAYNEHLSKIVQSQQAELEMLERQLTTIQRTNEELVPFMARMYQGFKRFGCCRCPVLTSRTAGSFTANRRFIA
jgi:dynactin complex subunit